MQQGKVRALGISEASPETIRRAHAATRSPRCRTSMSLIYRADAEETLATTRKLNIAFVAYSPLGRGLLTGVASNRTRREPMRAGAIGALPRQPRPTSRSRSVSRMAKDEELHPGPAGARVAAAQGDHIIPIPGTKQKARACREYRRAGG